MTGFDGLSGDLILDHAFGLVLVLARVGATLAFLPGLGEATIPAVVKAGMVLTLTILLLPIIEPLLPPRPDSEVALGLLVMTELANGIWFGWLARVLTISLLAAIVLLTAIWVIGAWSSDQDTQTVDAQIRAAEQGRQNDSIVSDKADRMDAVTQGESTEPQNMPNKNAGQ